MNNKFVKLVSVALILILGGCGLLENKNTREYMENHFSYLEKVYPTRNVEELFEKFPNGAKINHSISSRTEEGSLDVDYIELKVDSQRKLIYGKEEKVNILNGKTNIKYEEDVIYENGQIKYVNNPALQSRPIRFLFEEISYQELKSFEMRRVGYENQQPSYSIGYWVPVNKYDFIDATGEKVYLSIRDHGDKYARMEIGINDLKYYVVEQINGE